MKSFVLSLAITFVEFSFLSLIMFLPHGASAVSWTYDLNPALPHESTVACTSLGGSWSNSTSTCALRSWSTLRSGYTVKVEVGATLSIIRGEFAEVRLSIDSGGRIANYGTISNNGTIENFGAIDNYNGGLINNTGTGSTADLVIGLIANPSGTINNHKGGVIKTSRMIFNWAKMNNSGLIENVDSGKIANVGSFENYGTLDNKGAINNGGGITNYGILNSYNSSNIIITDRGSITNRNGGYINSSGAIDNRGAITNYGNITTIRGKFSNSGTVKNGCGGFISEEVSGNPVTDICTSTTTTTTTSPPPRSSTYTLSFQGYDYNNKGEVSILVNNQLVTMLPTAYSPQNKGLYIDVSLDISKYTVSGTNTITFKQNIYSTGVKSVVVKNSTSTIYSNSTRYSLWIGGRESVTYKFDALTNGTTTTATTSIEQAATSTIYVWALSATVTAVILVATLLVGKTRYNPKLP